MSDKAIQGLKPELIWQRFYDISQVPRPSKKEEKALEYIKSFIAKRNLKYKEDAVGNIVIKVPATKGYENAPIVVLQGHIDMVCEKNKGTEHDFEKDPIKLIKDGDWITADGTTLGADNGIGLACALAVVDDKDSVHGPLEILVTIDEETGMTGVNALQPGFIEGKYLLNMDSEEDGAFYVGCCGGQDTVGYLPLNYKKIEKKKYQAYELMITGLKGGHSGLDIHQGRGNAIKLLALLLLRLEEVKYKISDISGGSLRNAIPREAEVTLLISKSDKSKVEEIIKDFVEDTLLELKVTDGGVKVKLEKKEESPKKVLSKKMVKKIINLILAMPHGVMAMSPDIEGLVETSTNLATLSIENETLRIGTSQRSAIESAKMNVSASVASAFALADVKIKVGDGYPGWQPNMDSKLLKISKDVYKEMFKAEPEVKAIHAGLETGLLGAKYEGLDMISFGPTIQGAHSPDERVSIPAVAKFYDLAKGILKELTEK